MRAACEFSLLLRFFWLVWKSQEAQSIFEEMHEAGVAPSLMSYNTLISGCVRAEAPNEALSVFSLMKEKGIKLDQVIKVSECLSFECSSL